MPIKKIPQLKKNYARLANDIATRRTSAGIYAILSQAGALADTMTPIDTSNLINSRYAPKINKTPKGMNGHIGYTAEYAKWVHEAPGTLQGQPRAHFGRTRAGVDFGGGTENGNYWDPNAEPQFLKKGFDQIKPAIPAILKAAYRDK